MISIIPNKESKMKIQEQNLYEKDTQHSGNYVNHFKRVPYEFVLIYSTHSAFITRQNILNIGYQYSLNINLFIIKCINLDRQYLQAAFPFSAVIPTYKQGSGLLIYNCYTIYIMLLTQTSI